MKTITHKDLKKRMKVLITKSSFNKEVYFEIHKITKYKSIYLLLGNGYIFGEHPQLIHKNMICFENDVIKELNDKDVETIKQKIFVARL